MNRIQYTWQLYNSIHCSHNLAVRVTSTCLVFSPVVYKIAWPLSTLCYSIWVQFLLLHFIVVTISLVVVHGGVYFSCTALLLINWDSICHRLLSASVATEIHVRYVYHTLLHYFWQELQHTMHGYQKTSLNFYTEAQWIVQTEKKVSFHYEEIEALVG